MKFQGRYIMPDCFDEYRRKQPAYSFQEFCQNGGVLQLQAEHVARNKIYFLNHTDIKDTFYVEAYV